MAREQPIIYAQILPNCTLWPRSQPNKSFAAIEAPWTSRVGPIRGRAGQVERDQQ